MPAVTKVLIISYEFPPNVGGIGNHAYNLSKALRSEGFEVTVSTDIINVRTKELDEFASQQNFKIYWVKRQSPVFLSYLNRIKAAISLSSEAHKIICTGKFPLWLGIIIRLVYPKKELIAIAHGSELDLKVSIPRKLTTFALKKFNKIISVSNYTQQHLPTSLPVSVKKFVIPNGINREEFSKIENRKLKIENGEKSTINWKQETPLTGEPALITVGSVTERKGQANVISALPQIQSLFPLAKYHVVGKAVITEQLKQQAIKLKVNDAVYFYGAVSRMELLRKLSGAHIKLMLSNHTNDGDFEGFGISILEANAFGIPAIGSRNSGIADAIEDGKSGLLVDQHNPKEVADAVTKIMSNYVHFSEHAKKRAMQYDWKNIVKEYIAVLKN